ncbi:MAG: methyltransferase domain-containing protein [candidate division Zixibacteria bacterium]|nr:methyltransferase domain-containing protein [candidate division Zixibacteria bacterium]MCI0595073.1 methyltransferase domain-containing protein [candidate division Zixibacteria bacterium]
MEAAEKVRDYFTRSASGFDTFYSEERVGAFMRFINRHFHRDIYERHRLSLEHVRQYRLESILDVGCGSGRYALGLAELPSVKRIVGIDFSSPMIALATANTRPVQSSGKSLEFICGDFQKFETDETFDGVLTMGLFDYVSDPVPVLEKMRQLVRHSVAASFPSISFYRTPIRKARYFFKRCPVYFYTSKKILALSKAAGFDRVETQKIKGSGMDYFAVFFK